MRLASAIAATALTLGCTRGVAPEVAKPDASAAAVVSGPFACLDSNLRAEMTITVGTEGGKLGNFLSTTRIGGDQVESNLLGGRTRHLRISAEERLLLLRELREAATRMETPKECVYPAETSARLAWSCPATDAGDSQALTFTAVDCRDPMEDDLDGFLAENYTRAVGIDWVIRRFLLVKARDEARAATTLACLRSSSFVELYVRSGSQGCFGGDASTIELKSTNGGIKGQVKRSDWGGKTVATKDFDVSWDAFDRFAKEIDEAVARPEERVGCVTTTKATASLHWRCSEAAKEQAILLDTSQCEPEAVLLKDRPERGYAPAHGVARALQAFLARQGLEGPEGDAARP